MLILSECLKQHSSLRQNNQANNCDAATSIAQHILPTPSPVVANCRRKLFAHRRTVLVRAGDPQTLGVLYKGTPMADVNIVCSVHAAVLCNAPRLSCHRRALRISFAAREFHLRPCGTRTSAFDMSQHRDVSRVKLCSFMRLTLRLTSSFAAADSMK